MEIFCLLLFGHLLADFTFQTNTIANMKRKSPLWLWIHVLIHPLCYIPLIWPYMNTSWTGVIGLTFNGWVWIFVITMLHWGEDYFRVKMVNRGWRDNILFYVWDQMVHVVVLVLISPLWSQALETKWPLIGCLFVGVTHFSTVTVWFIEKEIYGREFPETEEKYISMLQRLVVWLFFFLPNPWWYAGPLIAMGIYARHIWTKKIDFSWTSIVGGNVLAVAAGLTARFGLHYYF